MLGDISVLDKVYIVCGRTDMRKQIDGLCAIIEEQLKMDTNDNCIFLFCGRKKDRIKAIYRDVFCKYFLAKVAKYFWRMLHLQIGESCKTFVKNSQERCSARVVATKYEFSNEKIHCRHIPKPLTLFLL